MCVLVSRHGLGLTTTRAHPLFVSLCHRSYVNRSIIIIIIEYDNRAAENRSVALDRSHSACLRARWCDAKGTPDRDNLHKQLGNKWCNRAEAARNSRVTLEPARTDFYYASSIYSAREGEDSSRFFSDTRSKSLLDTLSLLLSLSSGPASVRNLFAQDSRLNIVRLETVEVTFTVLARCDPINREKPSPIINPGLARRKKSKARYRNFEFQKFPPLKPCTQHVNRDSRRLIISSNLHEQKDNPLTHLQLSPVTVPPTHNPHSQNRKVSSYLRSLDRQKQLESSASTSSSIHKRYGFAPINQPAHSAFPNRRSARSGLHSQSRERNRFMLSSAGNTRRLFQGKETRPRRRSGVAAWDQRRAPVFRG